MFDVRDLPTRHAGLTRFVAEMALALAIASLFAPVAVAAGTGRAAGPGLGKVLLGATAAAAFMWIGHRYL
jgi:hypothetical protein